MVKKILLLLVICLLAMLTACTAGTADTIQPAKETQETTEPTVVIPPTPTFVVTDNDINISIGTSSENNTLGADGYWHEAKGFHIYGGTVIPKDNDGNIVALWGGFSDSAPVTIVNGNDYARAFHLSIQSVGSTLKSYYEDLSVGIDKLIESCKAWEAYPSSDVKSLEKVSNDLKETLVNLKVEDEPVLGNWEHLASGNIELNQLYEQSLSNSNYDILWQFSYLLKVYDNLGKDYQKYLKYGHVIQPFPEGYINWIGIEDLTPKVPIGGSQKVSVTLSIPYNLPRESRGHMYSFGILVEDWSQTGFVQKAYRQNWLVLITE